MSTLRERPRIFPKTPQRKWQGQFLAKPVFSLPHDLPAGLLRVLGRVGSEDNDPLAGGEGTTGGGMGTGGSVS